MKTRFPKPPLILLELNEINLSIVREYIDSDPVLFPGLRRLMDFKVVHTTSEPRYQNIEPWIQWVSVHTGLTYEQHRIFRLGDIVGSGVPQIYEALERQGVSVGCISPMNAENRLKDHLTSYLTLGHLRLLTVHGYAKFCTAPLPRTDAMASVGVLPSQLTGSIKVLIALITAMLEIQTL